MKIFFHSLIFNYKKNFLPNITNQYTLVLYNNDSAAQNQGVNTLLIHLRI